MFLLLWILHSFPVDIFFRFVYKCYFEMTGILVHVFLGATGMSVRRTSLIPWDFNFHRQDTLMIQLITFDTLCFAYYNTYFLAFRCILDWTSMIITILYEELNWVGYSCGTGFVFRDSFMKYFLEEWVNIHGDIVIYVPINYLH